MNDNVLPASFDPIYFSAGSWDSRVAQWIDATETQEFADGNEHAVRQAISDPDSGLVVVVNIGTHAFSEDQRKELRKYVKEAPHYQEDPDRKGLADKILDS